MRTACSLTMGGYLPGGVPAQGERGVPAQGGVPAGGGQGLPARGGGYLPRYSPRGQNSWHTLLKILPCPNFVAGGNKRVMFFKWHRKQNWQYWPPCIVESFRKSLVAQKWKKTKVGLKVVVHSSCQSGCRIEAIKCQLMERLCFLWLISSAYQGVESSFYILPSGSG